MQDYFKKEIKEGDLVYVIRSYEIEYGVLLNKVVRTLSTINHAIPAKSYILIEELTEEQKLEKKAVVEAWDKKKEENKKKEKERLKEFGKTPGAIYSTDRGDNYLYLGELEMIAYDYMGNQMGEVASGKIYLPYYKSSTLNSPKEVVKRWYPGSHAQKGFKRINGTVGFINFVDLIPGEYDYDYFDSKTRQNVKGKKVIRKL